MPNIQVHSLRKFFVIVLGPASLESVVNELAFLHPGAILGAVAIILEVADTKFVAMR